jgi:hypothetical protein
MRKTNKKKWRGTGFTKRFNRKNKNVPQFLRDIANVRWWGFVVDFFARMKEYTRVSKLVRAMYYKDKKHGCVWMRMHDTLFPPGERVPVFVWYRRIFGEIFFGRFKLELLLCCVVLVLLLYFNGFFVSILGSTLGSVIVVQVLFFSVCFLEWWWVMVKYDYAELYVWWYLFVRGGYGFVLENVRDLIRLFFFFSYLLIIYGSYFVISDVVIILFSSFLAMVVAFSLLALVYFRNKKPYPLSRYRLIFFVGTSICIHFNWLVHIGVDWINILCTLT